MREDRLERGVKGVGRRIHLCVADHDVRVVLRAVPALDGFAQRVLRGVVVLRAAVCERVVRARRERAGEKIDVCNVPCRRAEEQREQYSRSDSFFHGLFSRLAK